MAADDPAGSSGRGPGRARQVEWWAARWWWVVLPGWIPPFVWGGWWWLLVLVLVPAALAGELGTNARARQRRAARREAAAASLRPGVPLDRPPGTPPPEVPSVDVPVAEFTADGAHALAYAPSGQVLAVGGGDGRVRVWSGAGTTDPTCLSALTHPGTVTALGFCPQGRLLVTAGEEGTVAVWDVGRPDRPVRLATVAHPGDGPATAVRSVAVGPDGRAASGGADGRVVVWDLTEPRRPAPLARLAPTRRGPREQVTRTGVVRGVTAVDFSPDGRLLAVGGRLDAGRPVQLWDVADPTAPRRVARLRPHRLHPFGSGTPVCHALAFAPHRPLLVTAGEYGYQVHPPSEYVRHHPHGHDSAVVVWDLRDPAAPEGLVGLAERGGEPASGWGNRPLRATRTTLAGHAGTARCLAISPDGTLLATGDDVCLLLWDLTDPARPVPRRTVLAGGPLHALAFAPDGRQVTSVSGRGRVASWATA